MGVLTSLARAALAGATKGARRTLARLLHVEYVVPDVDRNTLAQLAGPWFQPLVGDWSRVRTVWRAPLLAALDEDASLDREDLRDLALDLLRAGAPERAITMLLELDDQPAVARALIRVADDMIAAGQWATIGGWLDRLPSEVVESEPDLLEAAAHVAAARGQPELASRRFHAPAAGGRGGQPAKASRRLLAASRLAVLAGDLDEATARATEAKALAERSGSAGTEAAAAWQLGSLNVLSGDLETAAASFRAAARAAPDGGPGRPDGSAAVTEADRLARRLADIRRDRCRHAEAEAELARSEDEAVALLHAHIASVSDSSGIAAGDRLPGGTARIETGHNGNGSVDGSVNGNGSANGVGVAWGVEMVVHVLGPLSVMVNGRPVRGWGARPRSLLAYLVIHRADRPSREIVMEALWPGADLPAARNNIQVAVYGARRALREATDRQIIVFERGVYRLASDVGVSIDLDAFECHAQAGRRLADAGRVEAAIAELESATALYRGDFLADARSDDWAVLRREQLRLSHLDVLDLLSSLYLETGQYSVCALLCRQILERDPCREDAHRRLMRSYARQGQPHLALLQFRTCADVLARELRVAPGPATVRLHERIRRHEPV